VLPGCQPHFNVLLCQIYGHAPSAATSDERSGTITNADTNAIIPCAPDERSIGTDRISDTIPNGIPNKGSDKRPNEHSDAFPDICAYDIANLSDTASYGSNAFSDERADAFSNADTNANKHSDSFPDAGTYNLADGFGRSDRTTNRIANTSPDTVADDEYADGHADDEHADGYTHGYAHEHADDTGSDAITDALSHNT
jgi:hypothetical protein